MHHLRSVLVLLRVPNLLILGATIYAIFHLVIYPPIIDSGIQSLLTSKDIWGIIFIILCIGAGGYVYNDIVDIKTDTANDKRGIVGPKISRQIALLYYAFLVLAPLLLLGAICTELDRYDLLGWYALITGCLWLYNQYLKRYPLVGNLMVATLCALSLYVPLYLEEQAIYRLSLEAPVSSLLMEARIFLFCGFAFLANLIREMIKDLEDLEGDQAAGMRTLPITDGVSVARRMTLALMLILAIGCGLWWIITIPRSSFKIMMVSVSLVSAITLMIRFLKAQTSEDYNRESQLWKSFFLLGIVTLLLTY